MKNFRRDDKSRRKGNRERPTMHRAICGECGKECEVPFKPTGDKPVFCSECFGSKRSKEPRRFGERDSGRFNSGDKKMYKVVCDECGKECEVPFRPTNDKPVYCSQCFSNKGGGKDKSSDQTNKQFNTINEKLDKILEVLSSSVSKTKVSKPKKLSKTKDKKATSPKKAKEEKEVKEVKEVKEKKKK